MLVTRNSVSLTRFIAPPGKPVFGILASQRGGPLDRDLALKWLKYHVSNREIALTAKPKSNLCFSADLNESSKLFRLTPLHVQVFTIQQTVSNSHITSNARHFFMDFIKQSTYRLLPLEAREMQQTMLYMPYTRISEEGEDSEEEDRNQDVLIITFISSTIEHIQNKGITS